MPLCICIVTICYRNVSTMLIRTNRSRTYNIFSTPINTIFSICDRAGNTTLFKLIKETMLVLNTKNNINRCPIITHIEWIIRNTVNMKIRRTASAFTIPITEIFIGRHVLVNTQRNKFSAIYRNIARMG